jgi:uracil-DNA glycosylase family 4
VGLVYYTDRTSRKPAVVSVAAKIRQRVSPELMERMGCKACPMDRVKGLKSPKMLPTGTTNPLVLILGEAPGTEEDKHDEQFIGPSGRLLRDHLRKALGLRQDDDENEWVRWNNCIRCHPEGNRDPTYIELTCCMPKQRDDIERTQPYVVLTCGATPLDALTGEKQIGAWRGRKLAYRAGEHECWIVPTYHPAYILRVDNAKGHSKADRQARDLKRFFAADVELAVSLAEERSKPLNMLRIEELGVGTKCLKRFDEVMAALKSFEGDEWTSTDIETTGLRPYHDDARILTASLSSKGKTIAFPIQHPEAGFSQKQQNQILAEYRDALLASKAVWCHNLNFELEWLAWKYGPEFPYLINGQCTMAQAYVLDERTGALALNDLSLMHFGMRIKELVELDKANLIEEPLDRVLPYNALDSKICSRVAPIQADEIARETLQAVYDMHRLRSRPIAIMQNLGMTPDCDEAERLDAKYKAQEKKATAAISEHPDIQDYVAKHDKDFAVNSPKSVSKLLVKLGYDKAASGSDEKILKEVDHPVADLILKMREFKKLRSTYIQPFFAETDKRARGKHIHDDGLIHTQFNHLLTATGRLSSEQPNMQNLPSREHPDVRGIIAAVYEATQRENKLWNEWMKELAGGDVVLLGCDYGQIEARVIGMASKDDFLCKALREDYDIHAEWAERLASRVPRLVGGRKHLTDKAAMKTFRSIVKNKWTFPLFYKAALYSVALALDCDEDDLRREYETFWDQFAGVRKWQDELESYYRKHGYVCCLTGRRRHGPMTPNMVVNSPIQGTASDIVVDAMSRLSYHAISTKQLFLHPRLNVHDDLTFYLPDRKLEDYIDVIGREMVSCDYYFVNVPLTVEVKLGRSSWGQMKEIAVLRTEDYK